ncbi:MULTISPECIES: hypothetical protein [Paenibacillus]|uniref:hypothetical protein n=1 Tax=Paenibacillus TaxID=44249 RepID=UPI000B0E0CFD|nr:MULTISPECIES: hypothetical protein [Paenibacillus]
MLLESENRKHALSGLLRLGTMPAEMATLVNVIVSLKKEHPEVHIEVTTVLQLTNIFYSVTS